MNDQNYMTDWCYLVKYSSIGYDSAINKAPIRHETDLCLICNNLTCGTHTWHAFHYDDILKDNETSFRHSNMIKFKTNIMMNNLPFIDTLTRSVKYSHLTGIPCQECLTESDSWQHLWTCPIWSTKLRLIITIAQHKIKTHLTRQLKDEQHKIDL